MKNRQNRFRLGWILIAIAAINCLFWVGYRWHYENNLMTAQLTVDYDDISVLADAYDLPFPTLLQKLKSKGITSVGLYNLTLANFVGNGRLAQFSRSEAEQLFPGLPWSEGYETLLIFNAEEVPIYPQILAHLKRQSPDKLPPRSVTIGKDQGILIPDSKQLIYDANMGFDPLQVQQVQDAGLTVTARLSNPLNLNLPRLDALLDDVQKTGATVVIFASDEVLGYSTMIRPVAAAMRDRGLLFGNIEFSKQRGWKAFSGLTNGQLVRVHSVGSAESSKNMPQTLTERYSLAIQERDMRVAYIRLLRQQKGEYKRAENGTGFVAKASALEQNLHFISNIKKELEAQPLPFAWLRPGMELGTAQAFGNYPMDQLTSLTGSQSAAHILRYLGLFLASLGVVGATLLMLNLFFDLSAASQIKWLIAGILLALLMLILDIASAKAHSGTASGGLVRLFGMWPQRMGIKLMATEVACLFPAIAILWGGLPKVWDRFDQAPLPHPSFKSTFITGVQILLYTSLILMIGPLIIITLLNHWTFFSGADKFFFTKSTQLMPLVLVALAFSGAVFPHRVIAESATAARKRSGNFFRGILSAPLTVRVTLVSLIVLVCGMIWMARSGNDSGMTISSLELHFRHTLAKVLVTRPRTKEFLLGFPAMLFAVWLALRQRWVGAFFAVILATIGQADMTDSFMHLHTPIFYALTRSIYALIIGIIGGGIVLWFCDRWVRRQKKEEG